MANAPGNNSQVDFCFPPELKQIIEQAAALRGVSFHDFAVSTLVESAERVIHAHQITVLSSRDRDIFLAVLDDDQSQPSAALLASAASYKEWLSGAEQ